MNSVSCNLGLKWYLWFQTKSFSTQFNYHLLHDFSFIMTEKTTNTRAFIYIAEQLKNGPRSINQYSNIEPRLSGKNCKLFKFLLSYNSQRRLGNKGNTTKYRSLNWKPRSHVRILMYIKRGLLPIYWHVLSQSEWSTFLSHIITAVIFTLIRSKDDRQKADWKCWL